MENLQVLRGFYHEEVKMLPIYSRRCTLGRGDGKNKTSRPSIEHPSIKHRGIQLFHLHMNFQTMLQELTNNKFFGAARPSDFNWLVGEG